MTDYQVILTWDEVDRIYVARALDLPGCAAHGGTREEAVNNIRDAIELWLDTAREDGDCVPEPHTYELIAV
ncbi:MAG TPA: type II toxin-antitoxin system HicB family antitoxin [Thermoanaerobaculia bacterium]|jgi:predicted RNase H-like HicB family nuclease